MYQAKKDLFFTLRTDVTFRDWHSFVNKYNTGSKALCTQPSLPPLSPPSSTSLP